jgi:hypothetical protein
MLDVARNDGIIDPMDSNISGAAMDTINISGQEFVVINKKPFVKDGKLRMELKLRKPKGRKLFHAVVYENGAISSVVTL